MNYKNIHIKNKLILSLFFLLIFSLLSYSSNLHYNKLKKAENFYRQGEYKKALKIYKNIEKKFYNYEIYYNIGNIYFKLKDYPMAKVYYMRAYKIKQNDSDLKHNIKAVELHLKDKIKIPSPDPFTKLLNNFKNSLPLNQFLIISIIILFLLSIIFTFYKWKYKNVIIYFLLTVFIITLIIDIKKIDDFKSENYVLLKEKVGVKSEPTDKANSVFIIHEGIDFQIKDNLSGWYLIVLKNGFRGWVKLEKTKDFIKI
jgi:tetratricopeptide (TPR) repeat protein